MDHITNKGHVFRKKNIFLEFKENKPNLSNNVYQIPKINEKNKLILKKVSKHTTEYHLTDRGLKLNKVLYELAAFGLDEMECGDERDFEIINMFKDYYANLLNLSD